MMLSEGVYVGCEFVLDVAERGGVAVPAECGCKADGSTTRTAGCGDCRRFWRNECGYRVRDSHPDVDPTSITTVADQLRADGGVWSTKSPNQSRLVMTTTWIVAVRSYPASSHARTVTSAGGETSPSRVNRYLTHTTGIVYQR